MTPRRMLPISCLDFETAWLLMRLGRFVYRSSPHCSFVQFVSDLCLLGTHDETVLRSQASFMCASQTCCIFPAGLLKAYLHFRFVSKLLVLASLHQMSQGKYRLMTIQIFSFDTESLWSLIQIANQVSLWGEMSASKRTSLSSPAGELDTRSVNVCSQGIRTFQLSVMAE